MTTNQGTLRPALLRSLEGVANATKIEPTVIDRAKQLLSAIHFKDNTTLPPRLQDWLDNIPSGQAVVDQAAEHAARLALAVTYLRTKSQHDSVGSVTAITPLDLSLIWSTIREALTSTLFEDCRAGRSHQGFFSVALCRLDQPNGDNDELWRLHVWLPSSPSPDPRLAIHSHKSFAQSWLLTGENENAMWDAKPTESQALATHAVYKLGQDVTLAPGSAEEMQGTVILNTGNKVIVTQRERETFYHDQSYVVPVNDFHTTGVGRETVLATLFVFDASRGFVREAGVPLGPADETEFTQYRNPEGVQLATLVTVVDAVRHWETVTEKAYSSAKLGEWTQASSTLERLVDFWKTYRLRSLEGRGFTLTTDFDGLDQYEDVAETLQAWAEGMRRSVEFVECGAVDEAIRICQSAQAFCRPVSHFSIVARCLLMLSEKLDDLQKGS